MNNYFNEKSNIGIDRLDAEERKNLFNKFVEAGGQVVEQKKRNLMNFDRERQKKLLKKLESNKSHSNKNFEEKKSSEHITKKQQINMLRRRDSALDRIKLYFKGIFNGVVTLSAKNINLKFFKFIKFEAMPSLERLDISLNYILASKENTIQRIIEVLDNMGKYYTDVFENFLQFYNEEEFNGILYFYNNENYKKVPVKLIEEPVKKIFKKLYILRKYFVYVYPSVKAALITIGRERNWDKKVLSNRLWNTKQAIDLISTRLFKKFYILTLFYLKENLPVNSKRLSNYLNITKEDQIGYHKIEEVFYKHKKEISEYFTTENVSKGDDDANSIKKYFSDLTLDEIGKLDVEDNVIEGLKLIKSIDRNGISEYDLKNTNLSVLKEKEKDKVLEIFFLLKEFEKEYSFILTSHRIVIKPIFENNKRVDYKDKLNAMYSRLSSIYELISNYAELAKSLEDVENDEALNPINKFNRITAIEGRRSKLNFEIRKTTKKYLGEVYALFSKIITDYNTKKLIVENPDDVLKFNTDIEGKKKVDGMKIIDAITTATNYLSGVLYRLEDFGDFAGIKTDLKENVWYLKDIDTNNDNTENTGKEKKNSQSGDFFDELEEFINKKEETPNGNS